MPGPYCEGEGRKVHRLEKVDEDHVRCSDCGEVIDRHQLKALVLAGSFNGGCASQDGPASLDRPSPPPAPPRKRPPPVV